MMATCEADFASISSINFSPHDFQSEAFDAIWRELDGGKPSTLVSMATGCGKTIVFGMVADEAIKRGGNVLVLAHRDELLEQAQAKLAFVGVDSAIEKAEQKARRSISHASNDMIHPRDIRCVVGSVQSLKGKRLESWDRDSFSLIIVDECHHAIAKSYRNVFKHFVTAKRLGVTATPARTDKGNIGAVFASVAYDYPLPRAIHEKRLAPIVWDRSDVRIDLRAVNADAADLNQGDLEDAISPHIEQMVRAIKERIGTRRAVLFAPGRKSVEQKFRPCQAFAEGLRKVGIPADAIWGDHPDRLPVTRSFREGEFQVLCGTANLLGEGVDFPFIESVILAVPTLSPVVFRQMVGRGTRLSPATGKENCVVIDFDWLIEKHKLCSPFSLVCPEGSDDAARIAAEILASGEETDVLKAAILAEQRAEEIAIAKAEEERRRREEEARRKAERQRAIDKANEIAANRAAKQEADRNRLERQALNLRVRDGASGVDFVRFDPFASTMALAALRVPESPEMKSQRATKGQVEVLVQDYGIDPSEAMGLSYMEAKALKTWCFDRYAKNRAPLWVVRRLMANGVSQPEALGLAKGMAFELMDRLGIGRQRRYG